MAIKSSLGKRLSNYLLLLTPRLVLFLFLGNLFFDSGITMEKYVSFMPNSGYALLGIIYGSIACMILFYIEVHQLTKLSGESTADI